MVYKELFKSIPKNTKRVAIYGAGTCGIAIKNAIEENFKDIKVCFFLDMNKTQDINIDIPIYPLTILEEKKDEIDLVIISVWPRIFLTYAVLEYYDIPYVVISKKLEQNIRNIPNQVNFKKAKNIFSDKKSKKLYEDLWSAKLNCNYSKIKKYVLKNHKIESGVRNRNYDKQYLEYINKNAIKNVFDCGFFNGVNVLNFIKNFPNLQMDYAFEPMYHEFKIDVLDFLITKSKKVQIVPYAVWDKKEKLSFCLSGAGSQVKKISALNNRPIIEVETIGLDEAKKMLNVQKVDFIKMDIEGSEQNALRGAENLILSDRPQMAISIYHSSDDFVNIPLYLSDLLDNYSFYLGHYSVNQHETVLYCIPNELKK